MQTKSFPAMLFAIIAVTALLATLPALASARVGHITALTVEEPNDTMGAIADISLEIRPGSGAIFIESYPLTKLDTQMSARMAQEIACQRSSVDCKQYDFFYAVNVHSTLIGGPSAGGALAVLTYAVLEDLPLRNDTAMTGAILSGGVIGPVGGVAAKINGARMNGITTVLVPAWESPDQDVAPEERAGITPKSKTTSGIVEGSETSGSDGNRTIGTTTIAIPSAPPSINVVPIKTIGEAIRAFTGREPPSEGAIEVPEGYTNSMRRVRETLCERARILRSSIDEGVYDNNTNNGTTSISTALNISESLSESIINATRSDARDADAAFARAMNASERGKEYTAASLCFGAAVSSETAMLREGSNTTRTTVLAQVERDRDALEKLLESAEAHNIADLEITMIVSERLTDVREGLATINTTDPDPAALAYASERLETARAWFTMLGRIESKELDITDAQLAASCRRKLDEAQERINYLAYVYPGSTSRLEIGLRDALTSAQQKHPALCLMQAAQAKAEANAILTAVYAPEDAYRGIMREKLVTSRRQLARQTEAGMFPILAYSYQEYADDLLEHDSYSGALYVEESLELGSLSIYFPERSHFPPIDLATAMVFFTGGCIGLVLGILITQLRFKNKDKPRHSSAIRARR